MSRCQSDVPLGLKQDRFLFRYDEEAAFGGILSSRTLRLSTSAPCATRWNSDGGSPSPVVALGDGSFAN
jgi:hypothetical protein